MHAHSVHNGVAAARKCLAGSERMSSLRTRICSKERAASMCQGGAVREQELQPRAHKGRACALVEGRLALPYALGGAGVHLQDVEEGLVALRRRTGALWRQAYRTFKVIARPTANVIYMSIFENSDTSLACTGGTTRTVL